MDLRVDPGTLLAAWPDLRDPNFMHTVLLICHHDAEGAYGLVVNRRTDFAVSQLLPDHPTLGRCDFPVHFGGPVDTTTLQFVHRVPERIPGGHPLPTGVVMGGDLDALGEFLAEAREAAERSVRVLLGYSGWGSGQLDGELASRSWIPAPGKLDAVFAGEGVQAWRQVVRSIGPEGETLGNQPPDVSWN